jgi:dipeptidyl aminopeptidase/acylaminoacyl peptidase
MNRKRSVLFTLLCLLSLNGCGVLEVGVEGTVTPAAQVGATSTPALITAVVTQAADVTPATLPATTPTATAPLPGKTPETTTEPTRPGPERSAVRVAFVKEGSVWLWENDRGVDLLTDAGDVRDVKISDDGRVVAFVRGLELWMVNSDGTGERVLISVEDIAAMVEPGDPGVRLYNLDWVPGAHVVAFNTAAQLEIGLQLHDDLHLVDADTLEKTTLLPRGEGGQFTYSPDGGQIAIMRSGTVTLVDAGGGTLREAFTFTPPVTRSEFQYYAHPVWAADSQSLRVAIPPADPLAQPPQLATVWHVYTDGRPAGWIATIDASSLDNHAFSPDLSRIAYVQRSGGSPATEGGALLVTNLENGDTVTYQDHVGIVYGWSPDSKHLAFLLQGQLPQSQIGMLGTDPVPVQEDPNVAAIDVRWLDAGRYLWAMVDQQGRTLFLGEIGGSSTVVATVAGRSLPYDYCLCEG